MNEWTTLLDSGAQVDVIYTDFAKAFDTVPHGRLLTHLVTHLVWPHQPENPPGRPRAWRISP